MVRDAAALLSAAPLFEIARRLAMPRARVKHAAPALQSLAEESAKDCETALRRKTGEGFTRVVCKCAAHVQSQYDVLCVLNFAVRYVGVRAADGSVVHQADAAASSKLVFHWTVCRGDAESLHESEVKCDHAVERGVPHPETAYCTKAELDYIATNAASSHEATLRQRVDQDDVVVMCKCAPTKIERASIFKGVGRTRLLVRGREKQRR